MLTVIYASVKNKLFMLSVIMLSVIMLAVMAPILIEVINSGQLNIAFFKQK